MDKANVNCYGYNDNFQTILRNLQLLATRKLEKDLQKIHLGFSKESIIIT